MEKNKLSTLVLTHCKSILYVFGNGFGIEETGLKVIRDTLTVGITY